MRHMVLMRAGGTIKPPPRKKRVWRAPTWLVIVYFIAALLLISWLR